MDPIDRQAAIDAIQKERHEAWEDLKDCTEYREGYDNGLAESMRILIDDLPSAQPEIIRCKDCKHYNAGFECLIDGYGIERGADWYCADAERREE